MVLLTTLDGRMQINTETLEGLFPQGAFRIQSAAWFTSDRTFQRIQRGASRVGDTRIRLKLRQVVASSRVLDFQETPHNGEITFTLRSAQSRQSMTFSARRFVLIAPTTDASDSDAHDDFGDALDLASDEARPWLLE